MMTIEDVLMELEQEAPTTRRVLERVPDDRLGWRPHPKSDTLGQLALHIANVPAAIAELATQPSLDVRTPIPRAQPDSTAQVLAAFDRSIARTRAILSEMPDASLAQPWRMMLGDQELARMPRAALLRSVLLNHWYHHRGQLSVYLRLLDVPVPAIYGRSADDNPFA